MQLKLLEIISILFSTSVIVLLIHFLRKGILKIEGFQRIRVSLFITSGLFCVWNVLSAFYENRVFTEIIELLFALSMVSTVIIWFDNELKKTSSYLIKTQEIRSSQIMMKMVTDKVNNPLQTIALLVRELQLRYPDEYLLVEILSEIDKQTMRVGNGLKSIVNYTMDPVESDWIEFFELNSALHDVLDIFHPLFVEQNITVIESLYHGQILIRGKDTVFKQAILNIFNACYTVAAPVEGHGKIKVFSDILLGSANIRFYLESSHVSIISSKNIFDTFCLSRSGDISIGTFMSMAKKLIKFNLKGNIRAEVIHSNDESLCVIDITLPVMEIENEKDQQVVTG